jgi:hypothetical protein
MSRDLNLINQPAQPCVICGKATDASVYIVDRKVPMCPDCSIRFEDDLAEKGGPLPCPPELYRYRAPSDLKSGEAEDGSPSRFEQFLTTDQVWASNPTQFNDPYDCRQTYDFAASPEEWEKRVDHGIVGALAGYLGAAGKLPRYSDQLETLRADLKKEAKYNDPAVQAGMGNLVQEFLDKARVLCLCETQTNPRLWAHYADGHRGFCLEFDTSMKPFHAYRVRYTQDYPKLGINATPDQCLRTFLLTKSELWKDEEEWRCVDIKGGPAQWPISTKALKAVIFGTRASADLRATIARLIAAHKPWVELREVVEVPFSYDLQVKPLPAPNPPGAAPDV